MVFQTRLDYGFNGYQVPEVPRASRSVRGRVPIRKKVEDNQIHAFEILASVAGKFLLDGESSSSNAKHNIVSLTVNGEQEGGELLKTDACDGETCNDQTFSCVAGLQERHQNYKLHKFLPTHDTCDLKDSLVSKDYDQLEKVSVAKSLTSVKGRNALGSPSNKVNDDFLCTGETLEGQLDDIIYHELEVEPSEIYSIKSRTLPHSCGLKHAMVLGRKPPALVGSGSNIKVSLHRDCVPVGPFSRHCANVEVVSRDDDENSVGCNQSDTISKAYRSLAYDGDQRTKNLSASRHWKVASNFKGGGYFGNDGKTKPVYRNGRTCYTRQSSQRIYPFKKRKFFDRNPISISNGLFRRGAMFNYPGKRSNGDNCHAVIRSPSQVSGQQAPPDGRDCNVKLSIKSFKVPELFIEIPATATVGSLKRTVMEAVTAILGDGLHVGVLLQGKKVGDDSKTLLQTGISKDDGHNSLGFMLESKHAQVMPSHCVENPVLLSKGTRGLTRHISSFTLQHGTCNASSCLPDINLGSHVECDLDVVSCLADPSTRNTMSDTRALVAVPEISMEALAVVPCQRKPGHPEFVQRRIRRPFSVLEVEALVQAVEKLGTGRWRDVKLCAFENVKHRTYVDLKDKWKTLVHTAKISPQQRRGKAVPQELLDRVLTAHTFGSQQQAKHQQIKAAVI